MPTLSASEGLFEEVALDEGDEVCDTALAVFVDVVAVNEIDAEDVTIEEEEEDDNDDDGLAVAKLNPLTGIPNTVAPVVMTIVAVNWSGPPCELR